MNLCLSLITHGLEDIAFYILKTFPTLQPDSLSTDTPNLGNFFLRHCVTMDTVCNIFLASVPCSKHGYESRCFARQHSEMM